MIDTTRFAELVQRDQRSTAVRDQFLLLVAHDGMCAMMSAAGVILSNGGASPQLPPIRWSSLALPGDPLSRALAPPQAAL
ncbi:MAG TPA: hypothetical protein VK162_08585 [Streptosporangiaceae bacterium]|nr:hypothetical protein [Streptosporangiaceae bacterium]